MAAYRRRDLVRPERGVALAICLLAICSVRSDPVDPRPSDHGLARAKDPGPASPTMAAFFRGRPPEVALPEALDLAEPARNAAAEGNETTPAKRRSSAALLTAGVACGVAGVALVGAAALGYAVRWRLGGREGSGLSLVRWRGGSDAQSLRFGPA